MLRSLSGRGVGQSFRELIGAVADGLRGAVIHVDQRLGDQVVSAAIASTGTLVSLAGTHDYSFSLSNVFNAGAGNTGSLGAAVGEPWISMDAGPHEVVGVLKADAMYRLVEDEVPEGYLKARDMSFTVGTRP